MRRLKRFLKKQFFHVLPSSTVIMLHHIDDGNMNQKSDCVLSKDTFIELIDTRIPFISMEDYCNFRFTRCNPCTITFDDGLQDVYRVAYPELKKRKIPFTIFVVTDFLDSDGYLTTKELMELASDPLVTVGSHGISHDILKGMPAEQQLREFTESKRILQDIIGKDVCIFAYSHGQYDQTTLRLLKNNKLYDYAFSAAGGQTNVLTRKNRLLLPRFNLTDQTVSYHIQKRKNRDILKLTQ